MSKILRNVTSSLVFINDTGVSVPASGNYTVPPQDYLLWAASNDVVTVVGNSTIVVNDGSSDLGISDGIDLIKGLYPRITTLVETPVTPVYAEISSVASGFSTTILTYIASSSVIMVAIHTAGTNIAQYDVKLNGNTVDRAYTNFGAPLNAAFNFKDGIQLTSGDIVTINLIHYRTYPGDFSANILIKN